MVYEAYMAETMPSNPENLIVQKQLNRGFARKSLIVENVYGAAIFGISRQIRQEALEILWKVNIIRFPPLVHSNCLNEVAFKYIKKVSLWYGNGNHSCIDPDAMLAGNLSANVYDILKLPSIQTIDIVIMRLALAECIAKRWTPWGPAPEGFCKDHAEHVRNVPALQMIHTLGGQCRCFYHYFRLLAGKEVMKPGAKLHASSDLCRCPLVHCRLLGAIEDDIAKQGTEDLHPHRIIRKVNNYTVCGVHGGQLEYNFDSPLLIDVSDLKMHSTDLTNRRVLRSGGQMKVTTLVKRKPTPFPPIRWLH